MITYRYQSAVRSMSHSAMNRRDRFLHRVSMTHVLVLMLLLMISSPTLVNAQVSNNKASILDTTYTVQNNMLHLTVKIGYSFDHQQYLKLTAESYSPPKTYSKPFAVQPGTDVRSIDFDMSIPSGITTWAVAVSLYLSNEKGDTLDLLHLKNLDVNVGTQSDSGGGLFLLIGLVVIVAALYFGGRKKKQPELDLRKRHH